MLIIGGNRHSFAAPAAAFAAATQAGIGTALVLLPDVLRKTVGAALVEADFAPTNLSGSFGRSALDQFLQQAAGADGVLLAGDLGRNSETAILLDSFLGKYRGQVTLAQDALDYFLNTGSSALGRPKTTLVINLGKLQKLAKNNQPSLLIQHSMSTYELVQKLSDWSQTSNTNFITKHEDNFVVAVGGKVSTTAYKKEASWQVDLPAYNATWLIQQPKKAFEALTTAAFAYQKANTSG